MSKNNYNKMRTAKTSTKSHRSKYYKLSLVLFLIVIVATGVLVIYNSQASSRMARRGSNFPVSKLTVMTWNLRYGGQRVGYDLKKYADVIKFTDTDIVFIQETYHNQIDDLAKLTGMNYKFVGTAKASSSVAEDRSYTTKYGKNPQYGHAILSKYPLGAEAVVDLPSSDEKRKMLVVNTWINGTGVRLANTHLTAELNQDGRNSRARSSDIISDKIAKDNVFTIFGGDLNANISELAAIKKNFYVVANSGSSTPSEFPTKRFDYIGVRNAPSNLAGISDNVLINTYSDHRPVLYTMLFKK